MEAQSLYEIADARFTGKILGSARLEELHTGCRWTEGPVWFSDHDCLYFSDIPNERVLRYLATDHSVSTYLQPSRFANGHTRDRQGRLISCEHGPRRVTRTEPDGSATVLADRFEGKKLNSPNDVVVKSDGSIWFTDPSYGILGDYEGKKSESEIGACHVYRIDPASGEVTMVADDFVKPNGLAFSPDESILYIADTGISHDPKGPKHIRALKVNADGKSLGASKVFAVCTAGLFDGFRVDRDGRIWSSAADGVHCYTPGGDLIGKIKIPEIVGNVCFGGPVRNRLFICGCTSLYSAYLSING
jgi:gluconolactonase